MTLIDAFGARFCCWTCFCLLIKLSVVGPRICPWTSALDSGLHTFSVSACPLPRTWLTALWTYCSSSSSVSTCNKLSWPSVWSYWVLAKKNYMVSQRKSFLFNTVLQATYYHVLQTEIFWTSPTLKNIFIHLLFLHDFFFDFFKLYLLATIYLLLFCCLNQQPVWWQLLVFSFVLTI